MNIIQIAPPWLPVPPAGYGGTELIVGHLTAGLIEAGWKVDLFCRDASLPATVHRHGFPERHGPNKYSEIRYLSWVAAQLADMPAGLVHSHLETFAGFRPLVGRDFPLLITLHIPVSEAAADYLASFPDVWVAVPGKEQYERLSGLGERAVQIPHGIDVGRYEFSAAKEDYLLYLGRIYEDKGVEDAVELAEKVDMQLLLAGPVYPGDWAYFHELVQGVEAEDRVVYVGEVDFAQKNRLLSRATALVHPVRVQEAFGLTLVEAAACGTPVIALDRGAVHEVVADGVTGVVVDDVREMVDRFPEVAALKPAACRDWAETRFQSRRMVEDYLALYQKLIG
jgi:glycosyltransferase involved in cell wall biosynthesis